MSDVTSDRFYWVVSTNGAVARLSACKSLDGARTMAGMLRLCGCEAAFILNLESETEDRVRAWCSLNRLMPRMPSEEK